MTTSVFPRTSERDDNPEQGYSLSYRILHWLMGGSFVLLLIAGQQFNFSITEAYKMKGLMLHSSLGAIVLIACLLLMSKRFVRRDKRPDNGLKGIKHWMANMAQGALYTLALLVPLSGLVTAFYSELPTRLFGLWNISQFTSDAELFTRVRLIHEWLTFLAIALAAFHIGAALYHHFIKQDQVLASMLLKMPRALKSIFLKSE